MDYSFVCNYLDCAPPSSYGLECISALVDIMRLPLDSLRIVHITGTNGKGSSAAFIRSAISACGYKVGGFSSPQVFDRKETITLCGEPISESQYVKIFGKVYNAIGQAVELGHRHPSAFEIETAMALAFFCEMECDIAVIEVGLGGVNDATNVISNTCVAAFAPISADHLSILGGSLVSIARQKAGIIKDGCTVVSSVQSDEVAQVLEQTAKSHCAQIKWTKSGSILSAGIDGQTIECNGYNYRVNLLGEFQAQNLSLAIGVIDTLREKGLYLPQEKVAQGIASAIWNGRMQVIGLSPTFIIDGAHNVAAAKSLASSIRSYYPHKSITLLIGIFKDKDYLGVLNELLPIADKVVTFDWDNPRVLSGKELLQAIGDTKEKTYVSDINEAVSCAVNLSGVDGLVLATGSLSHLKYIIKAHKEIISK